MNEGVTCILVLTPELTFIDALTLPAAPVCRSRETPADVVWTSNGTAYEIHRREWRHINGRWCVVLFCWPFRAYQQKIHNLPEDV